MGNVDRKHLSVADVSGLEPKAGEPEQPRAKPRRVLPPAPDGLIMTSEKTGYLFDGEDMLFWRCARVGKKRSPIWRMRARLTSQSKLMFRSKRALKNYQLTMPKVAPSDFDLMVEAFNIHSRGTQAYRVGWKQRELCARGTAHDHKARWLDDLITQETDCCLFFPGAKAGQPVKVKFNYTSMAAAKAALIKSQGLPDNPKALAIHKCGMGHMSCCNPRHLAWGTAADNAADKTIHKAANYQPETLSRDLIEAIEADRRLTNVIAWELRIPAGQVSAVKLRAMP